MLLKWGYLLGWGLESPTKEAGFPGLTAKHWGLRSVCVGSGGTLLAEGLRQQSLVGAQRVVLLLFSPLSGSLLSCGCFTLSIDDRNVLWESGVRVRGADVTQRRRKEQESHLTAFSCWAGWAGLAVGKSSIQVRALGSQGVPFPPPRWHLPLENTGWQESGLLPCYFSGLSPFLSAGWSQETPAVQPEAADLASEPQLLQPGEGGR